MDKHDTNAVTVRPHMQEVIERTDLVDGDLLARFLLSARFRPIAFLFGQGVRLDESEIRVISLRQPAARQTRPARDKGRTGVFAEQRIGKSAGQVEFSNSPQTCQQERMRQTGTPLTELIPDILVQFQNIHEQ